MGMMVMAMMVMEIMAMMAMEIMAMMVMMVMAMMVMAMMVMMVMAMMVMVQIVVMMVMVQIVVMVVMVVMVIIIRKLLPEKISGKFPFIEGVIVDYLIKTTLDCCSILQSICVIDYKIMRIELFHVEEIHTSLLVL